MKRPNITPGEWTACIGQAGKRYRIECRGIHNDCEPVATLTGPDSRENAQSVAALPDLLAALEKGYKLTLELRNGGYCIDIDNEHEAFKAALEKAGYTF